MADLWTDDNSQECLHCGATLKSDARMCRSCGADANCGWQDDQFETPYEPEDEFDYDDFVAKEFPEQVDPAAPDSQKWVRFIMLIVIISLLLSLAV